MQVAAFFLPHPEVLPILGRSGRKPINGRCGAARTPQQSSKRPHPTQGPHCVLGNRSVTVLRWLPLLKKSQRLSETPTRTGRGGLTQGRWQEHGGARALGPRWRPGPARRPRAGAAAPGGGAKPCGPPAPGREAPSPRPLPPRCRRAQVREAAPAQDLADAGPPWSTSARPRLVARARAEEGERELEEGC